MFSYLSLLFLASSYVLIHGQDLPEPFKIDTQALLYFTKLNVVLVDNGENRARRNVSLTANQPTETQFNLTHGQFTLTATDGKAGDLSVSNFNLGVSVQIVSKEYWTISNLALSADGSAGGQSFQFKDVPLISSMDTSAPRGRSFHCTRFGPWVGVSDKIGNFTPAVEFTSFQMEAFMKDNSKFGPSYDCVGFFSIGIWSGIFVTIILLSILSWGITMVMSVKTMDRFDDPKSKPISVGTAD